MFIRNIELNNFRVYKGLQTISFDRDESRNVFIITGNNGYGKTSFLTSLVWCLYGKNMQEVDATFKSTINEFGGYKKYLHSCMNKNAFNEGEKIFKVQIVFTDISVPGFSCNEVLVERMYNIDSDNEKLQILIDGQENELVLEVGKEIFIHDFILPKEIAKFFFFDAEKNVSLAEAQSLTDKTNLSKAYSEILGIKKYEELKSNLLDLRLRYRKSSANTLDTEKIITLEKEIQGLERSKIATEEKVIYLSEKKDDLRLKTDVLQEKLIREGSTFSVEQVKIMHSRKKTLSKEFETLKSQFNELMELAPFAIAGNLMIQTEAQLNAEAEVEQKQLPKGIIEEKINTIQKELKKVKNPDISLNRQTKNFYEQFVSQLLEKHLLSATSRSLVKAQHNFGKQELGHFKAIMENLRSSYRLRLSEINRRIKNNRFEFNKLVKKLSDAEARNADQVIQTYQNEKHETEKQLSEIEGLLHHELKAMGSYEHQYANKKKVLEELSRKVHVLEKYKAKDELAEKLVAGLERFLLKIRNEKRKALESRILASLQALMHKNQFVTKVQVVIENDMIDIELFHQKEKIIKENLSKGEQQLYATALLKALVEESNIKFPVFIDSPMQKYDTLHASKVITEFYPSISDQVVIFPLLYKEMTEEEYQLLLPFTKAVYTIENNQVGSSFKAIDAFKLFTKLKSSDKVYA